jgi:hypothetical protein
MQQSIAIGTERAARIVPESAEWALRIGWSEAGERAHVPRQRFRSARSATGWGDAAEGRQS